MAVPRRAVLGLIAVAAASLALVLIPAGSAQELRPAGTTATYTDATGDAKSAPDVSTVALDLDAPSGALKLDIALANNDDLANRGAVLIFLNTDRNSGTGDRLGSDYAIFVFADGLAFLKWNGKEMDVFNHQPTLLARAPGKVTVVVCTCDLGTQTFDFAVAGVRGEDVDVAPDTGPASFPVQENAVSIESLLVATKPLRPMAGKRFTLSIAGIRLGGSNEVVAPDTYSCSATLAGRTLKGSGVGGCAWLLPKKARGKKLTVSVNVSYHGDSETFSQTYKVR